MHDFRVPRMASDIARYINFLVAHGSPNGKKSYSIFVNMDIARISELSADQCLKAFDPVPWNMGVDRPGDISYGEYDAKR